MTAWGRALLGGAFGAVATLAVHPTSRPFLSLLIRRTSPEVLVSVVGHRSDRLPPPQDPVSSALWIHTAAERMVNRQPLSRTETQSVLLIARASARRDPDNAFWKQMQSVLLDDLGHKKEAQEVWARASRTQTYNDYQSERLLQSRDKIASIVGSRQAWQLGFVYYGRSVSAAILIERFARTLLSKSDLDTKRGLENRYETLRNGHLLKLGSRSMPVGIHGANIVELACYPWSLIGMRSPKKLLLAQMSFYNGLMQVDTPEQTAQARTAFEMFRDNDGWRAMTQREQYDDVASDKALMSVFTASIPSALLASCLAGLLLWASGRLIQRHGAPQLPIIAIGGAAIITGFLTFSMAHSWLSAMAVALSVSFLSFGPDKARTERSEELGPLFSFMIWSLALTFFVTFVGFAVGLSSPAGVLFPLVGFPGEFFGNTSMFIGLSSIVLGLLVLTASVWAVVQRRSTSFVLGLAIRRFGAVIGVASLILAMVTTPIAVYIDRDLEHTLNQLVGNEPVHYLYPQ